MLPYGGINLPQLQAATISKAHATAATRATLPCRPFFLYQFL
jgi:hypothetical protein